MDLLEKMIRKTLTTPKASAYYFTDLPDMGISRSHGSFRPVRYLRRQAGRREDSAIEIFSIPYYRNEEGAMKNLVVRFLLVVDVSVIFVSSAFAEHIFGHDELDTTYGGVFRLRQELWENAFDVDTLGTKNENFFRLKTSVWANLDYDKKVALLLKLTNEAKYYISSFRPSNNSFDEDELVFDNL